MRDQVAAMMHGDDTAQPQQAKAGREVLHRHHMPLPDFEIQGIAAALVALRDTGSSVGGNPRGPVFDAAGGQAKSLLSRVDLP